MDFYAIKDIYFWVLKENYKIQYYGNDKYAFVEYHNSGEIAFKSEYKNGERHGERGWWNLNGGEIWVQIYKNGEIVGQINYD